MFNIKDVLLRIIQRHALEVDVPLATEAKNGDIVKQKEEFDPQPPLLLDPPPLLHDSPIETSQDLPSVFEQIECLEYSCPAFSFDEP